MTSLISIEEEGYNRVKYFIKEQSNLYVFWYLQLIFIFGPLLVFKCHQTTSVKRIFLKEFQFIIAEWRFDHPADQSGLIKVIGGGKRIEVKLGM